jgi:hypothetical protein
MLSKDTSISREVTAACVYIMCTCVKGTCVKSTCIQLFSILSSLVLELGNRSLGFMRTSELMLLLRLMLLIRIKLILSHGRESIDIGHLHVINLEDNLRFCLITEAECVPINRRIISLPTRSRLLLLVLILFRFPLSEFI